MTKLSSQDSRVSTISSRVSYLAPLTSSLGDKGKQGSHTKAQPIISQNLAIPHFLQRRKTAANTSNSQRGFSTTQCARGSRLNAMIHIHYGEEVQTRLYYLGTQKSWFKNGMMEGCHVQGVHSGGAGKLYWWHVHGNENKIQLHKYCWYCVQGYNQNCIDNGVQHRIQCHCSGIDHLDTQQF